MKYYIKAFKNYAKSDGRATRKEFWWFILFHYLFAFAFSLIDTIFDFYPKIVTDYNVYYFEYGYTSLVYLIVTACPAICMQIRRLHDIGKSGNWWFLGKIPILSLYLLYLNCKSSDLQVNEYGRPANYIPTVDFDDQNSENTVEKGNVVDTANEVLEVDLLASKHITQEDKLRFNSKLSFQHTPFQRFISFLKKYRKSILITLLVSFVLILISSTAYTLLENSMHSAYLHYNSTGDAYQVGCGTSTCPYCQGICMTKAKYNGPYSFPYYNSVSNSITVCELLTVVFSTICFVSFVLFIISNIKKKNS